jgi:hypothetical protein
MSKEHWVSTGQPVKPISRTFGLVAHPFELARRPPDDIGIDPFQVQAQLRPIEVAVVVDPAADARIVHLGQLSQGLVATVMNRSGVIARRSLACPRPFPAMSGFP